MKITLRSLLPRRNTPSVVIVGAGLGGIGAAVTLRRAGINTFTIIEKSTRVGGTWWDNQYPGAEVDTVSHVYSYPFTRHDWSRTHAKQPELHAYIEEVVDEYELRPHLRLGVGVTSAVWSDETHTYSIMLDDGETMECQILISATGFLNQPRYPDWPGLECFEGPTFHTSRWEHQHDLRGKTVALVGTGSTASQIVPALAPIVERLYVYQREPGWVLPKGDHDYTPDERAKLRNPLRYRLERYKFFWTAEKGLSRAGIYRPGSPQHTMGTKFALDFIDHELADRPDLKDAVTPRYPFWGKRVILNSTFYSALKHENVELVPKAVQSITRTGVVDADGVERPADVLVMATGFQTTNYLGTMSIVGRTGRSLQEYWDGSPRACFGITVPEFPNLFIVYGPGTNGGEIMANLLTQARYARRALLRMRRRGATAVEVKELWADMFDAWLQSHMKSTAFAVSNNYFKTQSGRVVTQWPFSAVDYRAMVVLLGRFSESYRRRS